MAVGDDVGEGGTPSRAGGGNLNGKKEEANRGAAGFVINQWAANEGTSARRPIVWWPRKKLADLDLPHKSEDKCVPRGVGKGMPYSPLHFEVGESIL